jgi:hypothetical protein
MRTISPNRTSNVRGSILKKTKESMLRNGKIGKEIPNYEFQKIIQSNLDLSRLPLELLDDEIC